MKTIIIILCTLCLMLNHSDAQWDVYPQHVAFRYSDNGFDEFTHYTPNNITFWTDLSYATGSLLTANELHFFEPDNYDAGIITKESLAFSDSFGDRVRLDYGGLTLVNGASWGYLNAYLRGNAGQIDIFNGVNGGFLARMGSTATNSDEGSFALYGDVGTKYIDMTAGAINQGIIDLYGSNGSRNVRIGGQFNPDLGYVYVASSAGAIAAGMYAEADGDGVIFADVKNFRVAHPDREDSDIWYASLEGPEVAIYDRGTAQLAEGEAFVLYPEHFKALANTTSITVTLTPLNWDTYGLAVIEKNARGFLVKELKGGTGNFSFDWECKSVRKGKEDFAVIRPRNFLSSKTPEIRQSINEENHPLSKKQLRNQPKRIHRHIEGCAHH